MDTHTHTHTETPPPPPPPSGSPARRSAGRGARTARRGGSAADLKIRRESGGGEAADPGGSTAPIPRAAAVELETPGSALLPPGRVFAAVGARRKAGRGGARVRRRSAGKESAGMGIDPTQLFLCQFEAVRKLLGNDQRAHLLPLGIEQLPALEAFDTVFSMGVLYHRRSPLDHLWQLKDQLAPGGELVLETLVVEGDENTVLVPGDRYAQMRNVYFIPSAAALKMWLEKCGFIDVRIVDACVTSTEEQRRTEWMTTESLADFLDPQDQRKTVEGYPAPLRAVIIATKPETQQSLAKKAR